MILCTVCISFIYSAVSFIQPCISTDVAMAGWAPTVPSACRPYVSSTARIRESVSSARMLPRESHSVLNAGE